MTLDRLRKRIDRIDRAILRLLHERARIARQIGELKLRKGLPIFDGKRETLILRRMTRSKKGSLSPTAVRAIFQLILRYNRRLQNKTK